MFVKHGDGKIVAVIDEDELTEEQKISVSGKDKQPLVKTDNDSDTSTVKKSGR